MTSIGRIEGGPRDNRIDQGEWIALIKSLPSLAPIRPTKGINPFTGKPIEFKSPVTSASVCIEGTELGSLSWAMDGSPILIVYANDEAAATVASVAEQVAQKLGAHFVLEAEKP
jgi:hypothetical protein